MYRVPTIPHMALRVSSACAGYLRFPSRGSWLMWRAWSASGKAFMLMPLLMLEMWMD